MKLIFACVLASSYIIKLNRQKQKSKKKHKITVANCFKRFMVMVAVFLVQHKEVSMTKDANKKQSVTGRFINVAIDRELYLKLLEVKRKTGRTIRHQISELIRNS